MTIWDVIGCVAAALQIGVLVFLVCDMQRRWCEHKKDMADHARRMEEHRVRMRRDLLENPATALRVDFAGKYLAPEELAECKARVDAEQARWTVLQ